MMRGYKWEWLLVVLPCCVSIAVAEPAASGVDAARKTLYPPLEATASAVGSVPSPEEDYQAAVKADNAGDLVDAGRLYMRAAKAGHAAAQATVAIGLRMGSADKQAFEFFRKSAEQGNTVGMIGLGTMYAESGVVPQDFVEARKWITRAADQGDKKAIQVMAHSYIGGQLGLDETARNSPEALDWIKRAVAIDDPTAIRALASAYRAGQFGLAVDPKQADELDAKANKLLGKEEKKKKKTRTGF